MSATHVAWMFELAVREGREAEFQTLMAEMAKATERNEPGTLEYEWFLSADGRQVHLWERYVDSAAALTHLKTFGDRFMRRFFDVLAPVRITIYGAAGEAVRAAMGDLNPPVMPRAAGFSRH